MNYKFIPNINEKSNLNLSENELIDYRIMYKHFVENILKSVINFKNIDEFIVNNHYIIPTMDDLEYNFYHRFSILNSRYLFLRNNIYIERLNEHELNNLKNNPTYEFFTKTYKKVLFDQEGKDAYTFYGSALPKNSVKSNSLIFEFAYDLKKISSMEQYNQISEVKKYIINLINNIQNKMGIPISFIEYNAIPDIFISEETDDLQIVDLI